MKLFLITKLIRGPFNRGISNLFLVLLTFLVGCTHTHPYSNYDELNSQIKGIAWTVNLSTGDNFKGRDIKITPDSLYWNDPLSNIKHHIPLSQVSRLVIVNHYKGAKEGFRLFMLSGVVTGVMLFLDGDDKNGFFNFTAEDKFLIGNSTGIGLGVIFGLPIGYIIGSRDVYIINSHLNNYPFIIP